MPFRAYLRTHDGQVSDKTITNDPRAALAAFAALVNRTDLDGQLLAAALTGDQKQIAYHRFDRSPGNPDYWRDRIDDVELPGLGRVGRPSEMTGGKRVNTYLDEESIAIATLLGDGNVSDGIRKALKQAAERLDKARVANEN